MNLTELKKNWDHFGKEDPYWAILTNADKKGNRWNEEDFFKTGRKKIGLQITKLSRLTPDLKFGSALDFGCGAGRLTQALANHFDHVVGVDIATSMIDLANAKNKKNNCSYILNEKNDLSLFESEKFDLIYSIITLQHMQPQYAKNYIIEFLRVLKSNGVAIFQVPSKPDAGTLHYHNSKSKIVRKLLNLIPRKKIENKTPIMEMYWISIQDLISFVIRHGAQILLVSKDNEVGEEWDSYTYFIRKVD